MRIPPNLRPLYEPLYLALGRFHHAFAHAEDAMGSLIGQTVSMSTIPGSTLDFQVVKAVLELGRFQTKMEIVQRILRVKRAKHKRIAFAKTCFSHLSDIQSFRNSITHNLTWKTAPRWNKSWVLADYSTVKEYVNMKVTMFDTDAIDKAANDIVESTYRISGIFQDQDFDPSPISWQYKSSLLDRSQQRTPLDQIIHPSLLESSKG